MARKNDRNEYIATRREIHKRKLVELFGDKCADCGQSFNPECYDFHHINEEEKSFELAPRMDSKFSTIYAEAKKCVMLCSCCHRTRHTKVKNPIKGPKYQSIYEALGGYDQLA